VTWEHPAPRIVASSTASKLVITIAPPGPGASRREGAMERVIERGCGLDVHKKSIAACVRISGVKGQRTQEVRTFGTTATELLALRDWLQGHGVTHVAMESTGVYWKPVFYVLGADLRLGQSGPHAAGARAEDRRAGLCLDRAVAGARAVAGQLRAAGADARAPRSHALPQDDRAGTLAGHQSPSQSPGRRRHQARLCRD
jgi:Transposase